MHIFHSGVKSDEVAYLRAFSTLVPSLMCIMEADVNRGTGTGSSSSSSYTVPPVSSKISPISRKSKHKAGLRRAIKALAKTPARTALDSPIVEAQTKLIHLLGSNQLGASLVGSFLSNSYSPPGTS